MRDRDYAPASKFLAEFFGGVTTQAVEIRALPNEHGAGRAAPLFTRDPADIEVHCARWDGQERAVYFGVVTRLLSMCKGTRAGLAELIALWVDIDCTKQNLDKVFVSKKLTEMMLPPSLIVDSGHGLHAYWHLKEALDVRQEAPGVAELEAGIVGALKQLAAICCGDPAVCDLARIMRLPGTHNTKGGELKLCSVLHSSGARYEYDELLDMLDIHRPVIVMPDKIPVKPSERPVESDVFLRYAQACKIKPPIDVGARLAAMEYLGAGDTGIHQTQLHVSASLVRHGTGDDEIAELLLRATQEAVGVAGANWNWQREEKNIRAMIATARDKFGPAQRQDERADEGEDEGADEKVVNMAEAAAARGRGRPKKDPGAAPAKAQAKAPSKQIVAAGDGAVAYWSETRGPIAVVRGVPYTYRGGFWERWDEDADHALKAAIQGILRAAEIDPKTSLTKAVNNYVREHPDLRVAGVRWNDGGVIVCLDGALQPKQGGGWQRVDHSPDHWATQRVEALIAEMNQPCPRWLEFLDGCFSDRDPAERAAIIASLQEWFGAALVRNKPRELRKALWLYGESQTGKTRILKVLMGLIGTPIISLKVRALERNFGPAALLGQRAWIADDAVGSGDEIDDAIFKVVVTGEDFSTDVKSKEYASGRLDIPIAFSGNSLPKVRDQSEAVYNRCILIPMHVVRSEGETAGKPVIDEIVTEHEQSGVFGWAMEGWDRLKKRGKFDPPQSMREAADKFRDANNPTMAFARDCIESDPLYMVDRRDLTAAFKAWYIAEYGIATKIPSQKFLINGLRSGLGCQDAYRHGGIRLMAGIKMTELGLTLREQAPRQLNEPMGSNCTRDFVNQPRS